MVGIKRLPLTLLEGYFIYTDFLIGDRYIKLDFMFEGYRRPAFYFICEQLDVDQNHNIQHFLS